MPSGANRIISGLAHYSAGDIICRVLASQKFRRVSCTAPDPLSADFSKILDGPARRNMYADLKSDVDWPVVNHSHVKAPFSISRPNTSRSTT